jgi:hypothetical protein
MFHVNLEKLLPVLAGFALLYYWIGPRQSESTHYLQELLILVLLPYLLIVGADVALGLRASPTWSMPVLAFVPLLLVSLLRTPNTDQLAVLYRGSPYLLCLIPVVGVLMLATAFRQHRHITVEPIQELAREGASIWGKAIQRPVGIVAGDGFIGFSSSLALPDHPRVWQAFGSQWWITPELVDEDGLLAFCRESDAHCNATSERFIRERNGWICQIEARRSLWGMTGPLLRVNTYFVPPKMVAAEQTCTGPTAESSIAGHQTMPDTKGLRSASSDNPPKPRP